MDDGVSNVSLAAAGADGQAASPFVMVMEAADVGDLNNRAAGWRLCGSRDRRILVQ